MQIECQFTHLSSHKEPSFVKAKTLDPTRCYICQWILQPFIWLILQKYAYIEKVTVKSKIIYIIYATFEYNCTYLYQQTSCRSQTGSVNCKREQKINLSIMKRAYIYPICHMLALSPPATPVVALPRQRKQKLIRYGYEIGQKGQGLKHRLPIDKFSIKDQLFT